MPLLPFRLKHDIRFNANSSKIFFFLFEQIFWGGGFWANFWRRRVCRFFGEEVGAVLFTRGPQGTFAIWALSSG
jgi:hypothetical protein